MAPGGRSIMASSEMEPAAREGRRGKGGADKKEEDKKMKDPDTKPKHGGENFDWHMSLLEVYTTLKDPVAPKDAVRDACLKCWQLGENRNRRVEENRQGMVAKYGDYPQVHGLLIDTLLRTQNEETQWRAARALTQLSFSNPDVSWVIMHNMTRETRTRLQAAKAKLEQLRAKIANEDDDMDTAKESLPDAKQLVAELSARRSGSQSLVSMLDPSRQDVFGTSGRVQECALHCLNNLANSCWEGHDLLVRDKVHKAAAEVMADALKRPPFVVSAAAGLMLSLSYRPETRPFLRDPATLDALGRVVLLDSTEHNSMSAALALANVTGSLPPHECPLVTPAMQIPQKAVNALQAGIAREQVGARYMTVWKIMSACTSLAGHERNHLVMAQNGLCSSLVELLGQKVRNPKTELGSLECILRMSFEPITVKAITSDAPDLARTLEKMCTAAMTPKACKTAEAALWAQGRTQTPLSEGFEGSDAASTRPGTVATGSMRASTGGRTADGGLERPPPLGTVGEEGGGEGGGAHVYISAHKDDLFFSRGLGALITAKSGVPVCHQHEEGWGNFEAGGVRGGLCVVVLLSAKYQACPYCRAEAVAATSLGKPVIVACFDPYLELAPWALPLLGEEPFIIDMAGVYYDPVAKGIRPAAVLLDEFWESFAACDIKGESGAALSKLAPSRKTAAPAQTLAAAPAATASGRPADGGGEGGARYDMLGEEDLYAEEPTTRAEMEGWGVSEVADWVGQQLGLPHCRDMFVANAVDGSLLFELDDEDLAESLAVSDEGDRARILACIRAAAQAADAAAGAEGGGGDGKEGGGA